MWTQLSIFFLVAIMGMVNKFTKHVNIPELINSTANFSKLVPHDLQLCEWQEIGKTKVHRSDYKGETIRHIRVKLI